MNRKIRIGNFEAACLLLNMIAYKILLGFPRDAAEDAGTAGWLMSLLVSVLVFVIFSVLSRLYSKFHGDSILDISESVIGGIGKTIVGILLMLDLLIIVPITLREFAEDIKVISLGSTPVSVILMLFSAGMVIGAWLGLETLTRIHALTVPVLAGAYILILILNIPGFEISRLAPWLGLGIDVITRKGISNLSLFSEIFVLFLIIPYLNNKSDFSSIGKFSLLFSSLFLVLSTLCYALVYPYPTTTEFFLPMYQMARSIRLGRFFDRIESAFILIWATSAFLYLSSGLYFLTFLFQKTFLLKYQRPLIFPFTVLIFTLGMMPENLYSTLLIEMQLFRGYSWLITLMLPLVLLMIGTAGIRNRRGTVKE